MAPSSTPPQRPPSQPPVQLEQRRFQQNVRMGRGPYMAPPPLPSRPVTTLPQQQQYPQMRYPTVPPGYPHPRPPHHQQQQQPQYHYALAQSLPMKRPHSTQPPPPQFRPPSQPPDAPSVAPPGTVNPLDLRQQSQGSPAQSPALAYPVPPRPISNPTVPQRSPPPPQQQQEIIDLTSDSSPLGRAVQVQPRPQLRLERPMLNTPITLQNQNPQGPRQQNPQQHQNRPQYRQPQQLQQQQQRQFQQQQHQRQFQQQQQQQQRQLQLQQQRQFQQQAQQQYQQRPQQQYKQPQPSFVSPPTVAAPSPAPKWEDNYLDDPDVKLVDTWFPELDHEYVPHDLSWLCDENNKGAKVIPHFHHPCDFCLWLKSKTGAGGKCFPSFAVLDGNGNDVHNDNKGGKVSLRRADNHSLVRPPCTTCHGFGVTCSAEGGRDPGREARYMQNDLVQMLVPKAPETARGEATRM
ncbi:hypothetical protein PG990_007205 [Apiospora arundinis]